jgi:hypothetical protein
MSAPAQEPRKTRQCGYKACTGFLGTRKCQRCRKGIVCNRCGRCRYCSGDFATVSGAVNA